MAAKYIEECVDDALPFQTASYARLHRWPQAEAEFVRSLKATPESATPVTAVDSISFRQMYLRSYTFSRDDDDEDDKNTNDGVGSHDRNHHKCFGARIGGEKGGWVVGSWRKAASRGALATALKRWVSCSTRVDVEADHDHRHCN